MSGEKLAISYLIGMQYDIVCALFESNFIVIIMLGSMRLMQ